jgi:hypothetical protein
MPRTVEAEIGSGGGIVAEASLVSDIAAPNTAVAANTFAPFDMLLLHRSCRLAPIITHSALSTQLKHQERVDCALPSLIGALITPWRVGSAAVISMFAIVAFFLSTAIAAAAPIDSADIHVIDGDTIRVYHQKPDVRLVGFNAPETRRAACEAEAELGAKATRRLRELVRSSNLDFEFVP